MYYQVNFSYLVLLVLFVVCELQSSENMKFVNGLVNDEDMYKKQYNQRNMLKDHFQNVLMNDSEQLFKLQKVFLLPRGIGGLCLNVKVTAEGRVTDNSSYPEGYCDSYFKNKSCIYKVSKDFKVLSAAPLTRPLSRILRSSSTIRQVLSALDPSFYSLTSALSAAADYNDYYGDESIFYNYYEIHIEIDKLEFNNLSQMYTDVTDALYMTLSWVSYTLCYSFYRYKFMIIVTCNAWL